LKNTVEKIASLGANEEVISRFVPLLIRQELPKGSMLIRQGIVERSLFFLEQGVARAFHQTESRDVTFWFGAEGEVLLSLKSYFSNEPGYESIELLEKSVVYKIPHSALQDSYRSDLDMSNWGRRFAESELLKADKRYLNQQFKTAAERYEEFIHDYPQLVNRIQLGHIASYLGVSQVTLSRIRGERR
jgi:CRP-like cAMP-binding protein